MSQPHHCGNKCITSKQPHGQALHLLRAHPHRHLHTETAKQLACHHNPDAHLLRAASTSPSANRCLLSAVVSGRGSDGGPPAGGSCCTYNRWSLQRRVRIDALVSMCRVEHAGQPCCWEPKDCNWQVGRRSGMVALLGQQLLKCWGCGPAVYSGVHTAAELLSSYAKLEK